MTLVVDRDTQDEVHPQERRRGFRVSQARPVKVYEPSASRFFPGQTRNISPTGLQLEFPSFVQLRPGRMITVHVTLDLEGRPLTRRPSLVPARVVWVKEEAETESVVVGVELLSFTTANVA